MGFYIISLWIMYLGLMTNSISYMYHQAKKEDLLGFIVGLVFTIIWSVLLFYGLKG